MLDKNWDGRRTAVCVCIDALYSFSEVVESTGLNRTRIFPVLSIIIGVAFFNQLYHTKFSLPNWGYYYSLPHRVEVKVNAIMHVKT